MSKSNQPQAVALAACAYALSADGEIQLLPAGEFHAVDGRPHDAPCWLTDAAIAEKLIADIAARANPLVIDYEHQTLLSAENGEPAPAAGWFKSLRWEDGVGLFATVEWTERAIAYIDAGEYKFISPVIAYDKATGAIKKLINAALTNNPAIDGMAEVVARLTAEFNPQENLSMEIEELLRQLRWMLNLPTLATQEEILAELQKGIDQIKQGDGEAIAANTLGIVGLSQARATDIAALTAKLDTATAALTAAQTELAALKAEKTEAEITGIVEAALTAGRLLPAQKEAAIELGRANLTALNKMIDGATPLTALTGTQTGGKAPAALADPNDSVAISALAQKYQAEELAAGRTVNAAQAVQYVLSQSH
ncbi:MAG: phage protease [Pseudomonadota bacterium]